MKSNLLRTFHNNFFFQIYIFLLFLYPFTGHSYHVRVRVFDPITQTSRRSIRLLVIVARSCIRAPY